MPILAVCDFLEVVERVDPPNGFLVGVRVCIRFDLAQRRETVVRLVFDVKHWFRQPNRVRPVCLDVELVSLYCSGVKDI